MSTPEKTAAALSTCPVFFADVVFTARELTTRQRLALPGVVQKDGAVESILWICQKGIIELRDKSLEEIDDTYASEALAKMSQAVMRISGLTKDEGEAGNESASTS